MVGHMELTLLTTCYLLSGSLFEERSRKFVEVANEVLLLFASILITMCMDTVTLQAKAHLGNEILGVLGLIFLLNLVFFGWTITKNCKAKSRKKYMTERKKSWEAVVEDQKETYLEI